MVHSGEKPFECTFCTKCFAENGDLKKHERIHSSEKPYQCQTCWKSFVSNSHLKSHEVIHSDETKDFNNEKYKGIVEHEQVFDILRKHGEVVSDQHIIQVSGTGGWKELTVVDRETGEVIIEKKFRKDDFHEIISDKEYGPYIDSLIDKAMTKVISSANSLDINPESYEEIKTLSEELGDEDIFDPEA